jgi:ADP-heptose:LPS heptosyltransferase
MICKQIGDGAYFFKTVNIMNFAAITPMCNLLVTGEGGAGHVGAASGCLVISLFGEAEPAIWRPYGEKHISLKARNCEVNSITVENVISTIESNEQISIDMNLHGRG